MNQQRRDVLKAGGSLGLLSLLAGIGLLKPGMALADWNKAAFEAKSLEDTLKALGVQGKPADSGDIQLNAPDIAENGAVVPVSIVSNIPNTQFIAFLIEKNPNALGASFTIPEGTEANVTTRVKMGQTSNVYALVKADGKFFMSMKEVKVTLGGCGG